MLNVLNSSAKLTIFTMFNNKIKRDMQFKTTITQKLPFFVALALATVLTSCGSFQYAGYDNDGIYGANENENDPEQTVVTTETNDSNYYKNYFAENSAEVDAIKEESEVFTDIDSYEGNYIEQATDTLEQRPAYGGWGQNSNTVTINYIDNGWMGWNDPWIGSYGWSNWGWRNRWNNGWGWNRWGNGWNNWGWNSGWGYGYGYGWNAGWCPPGYNNWGWNNGYYGRTNSLAYQNTRRGSILYNNNLNRRGSSALSRRDYSTSRLSNGTTRQTRSSAVRNSSSNTRSLGNSRTSRTSRINTRTTRPSTRTTRPTTTRPSTRTSSPSRTTRSSGSTTRSSGSTRATRSSGSSRSSSTRSSSSSSSSRSSGTKSSSSSRRGRG